MLNKIDEDNMIKLNNDMVDKAKYDSFKKYLFNNLLAIIDLFLSIIAIIISIVALSN